MSSTPPTPNLTNLLQQLLENQGSFHTDPNQLRTRMDPPGFQALGFETPAQTPSFGTTSIKLEIPRFDGKDALSWMFKIKQFFYFHCTPEAQRLHITSLYMEGEALTWFQWMDSNGLLHSWQAFLRALEIRFAPS